MLAATNCSHKMEQQQQLKEKKIKNLNHQRLPLNPNWAQLQQKLNLRPGLKPSRPSDHLNPGTQRLVLGEKHVLLITYLKELYDTSLEASEILDYLLAGKRKARTDEQSEDPKQSPLVPSNDDFSLTDAVAMDCEMVGVGQANRSALGRVTLVNKWGNVIYDQFVRPMELVADFRTHISGIRPKDLKKAKNFPAVQKEVSELIMGRILVGHALSNDFKALLLNHPKKDLRDSSEYPPFLKYSRIEDARATMLLYQKNRKEWEKFAKYQTRLKQKQQKHKQKKKPKETDVSNAHDASAASP
ncbi:unnamed protein product [Linum tenue]|uniref:RNA exonuclease 4 n=1 Tax=Linum tenue TaxID=586396 RepID=A0AAV0ITS0_9ROSI|nr:unnamed protein product [Linum tenue]